MHEEIIRKLKTIGSKKGFIPICEYSLKNLDSLPNDKRRIDIVWLDKAGFPLYAFEVDSVNSGGVGYKFNYGKLNRVHSLLPRTRVYHLVFNKKTREVDIDFLIDFSIGKTTNKRHLPILKTLLKSFEE